MLKKFDSFLSSINLNGYRKIYKSIKIVEMDLPKNIQALDLLYTTYWTEKNFISFDDFYSLYKQKYTVELEDFRNKTTMCKDCYYRGLPARIYRTWASIITQIHAAYVAEKVFGPGKVSMSSELDHKGADFQVKYKTKILNYQIKKKTFSREVRTPKAKTKTIAGKFIGLEYDVPAAEYFENPYKKDGKTYKSPYMRFIKNKNLKRFTNGFVVFTEMAFLNVKKSIDSEY